MQENDSQYEEVTLENVEAGEKEGWYVHRDDGWSFFVPAGAVVPRKGSTVRLYGEGIGRPFRGMMIDGQTVFYRTPEEDVIYREEELYGKDAAAWVSRWDAGTAIWSIEMGGFGPGYEQALQIATVEIVRYLIEQKPDPESWKGKAAREFAQAIQDPMLKRLKSLGLSGAQYRAALNLAIAIYRDGPIKVHKTCPEDRHIQVSNRWPRLEDV